MSLAIQNELRSGISGGLPVSRVRSMGPGDGHFDGALGISNIACCADDLRGRPRLLLAAHRHLTD